MKRKSPTNSVPFSQLFLHPLPDISLATLDLGLLSWHHCIKGMSPIKIYPCLSDHRQNKRHRHKICERAICRKYGKALTRWMKSTDFLTRWNAITVWGKGRGSEGKKGQFWAISCFLIELFLRDVLGLLAWEGTRLFWYVHADFRFMNFTTFCYLIS